MTAADRRAEKEAEELAVRTVDHVERNLMRAVLWFYKGMKIDVGETRQRAFAQLLREELDEIHMILG